jgi:hypothetical protein
VFAPRTRLDRYVNEHRSTRISLSGKCNNLVAMLSPYRPRTINAWRVLTVLTQNSLCTKPLRGREHVATARIAKTGWARGSGSTILCCVAPSDRVA